MGRLPRLCRGTAIPALLALAAGCASPDYDSLKSYYDQAPKTILVLPARNLTTDVEAPQFFMSTIAKPLVDRGYYVMPVHLTTEILAAEGVGIEGESWEIEPALLAEHFGADAVLYATIESWDTNYAVLVSSVDVALSYRLVDARTGALLWEDRGYRRVKGGGEFSRGGGLVGLAVQSVAAAFAAVTTQYFTLARDLNEEMLERLPPGLYHPQYEALQLEIAEASREAAKEKEDE